MKKAVFHPGYFGPIDQFCAYAQTDEIRWEMEDNYQKQTYRNRQYIYGANGRLLLNIPILHEGPKGSPQKYREIRIDANDDWQRIHWKSLESAYRSSPFFEFYEDDLKQLYTTPYDRLMAFNFRCWKTITDLLQLKRSQQFTEHFQDRYSIENDGIWDGRFLSVAKRKPPVEIEPYFQVFMEKGGFIPNLSILDLLFNLGPETLNYLLKAQLLPNAVAR